MTMTNQTCLELRWVRQESKQYPWRCDYNLVIGLDDNDCRCEIYKDDLLVGLRTSQVVKLGSSQHTHDKSPYLDGDREICIPFRNGAHAKWDSKKLGGIPVYAIVNDYVTLIEVDDD